MTEPETVAEQRSAAAVRAGEAVEPEPAEPNAAAGYAVQHDGAFARSPRPARADTDADVHHDSAPASAPAQAPAPAAGTARGGPSPQVQGTVGPRRSLVLDPQVALRLRDDWQQVQFDFVDDPRQAVEQADAVVGRAGQRIAEALSACSAAVRRSWQAEGPGSAAHDTGTSTEHLRVVLQQYRDLLNRMLEL